MGVLPFRELLDTPLLQPPQSYQPSSSFPWQSSVKGRVSIASLLQILQCTLRLFTQQGSILVQTHPVTDMSSPSKACCNVPPVKAQYTPKGSYVDIQGMSTCMLSSTCFELILQVLITRRQIRLVLQRHPLPFL